MKKGFVGIGADSSADQIQAQQDIQKARVQKNEQTRAEYLKDYFYRKLEINYKLQYEHLDNKSEIQTRENHVNHQQLLNSLQSENSQKQRKIELQKQTSSSRKVNKSDVQYLEMLERKINEVENELEIQAEQHLQMNF